MQMLVAHHFWKDGKNATWNPTRFPVPEIERAVKEDYEKLAAERPPFRTYGAWTVFFVYTPKHDYAGRTIVEISFAFAKQLRRPDRYAPQICALLDGLARTEATLEIRLTEEQAPQLSKKSTTFPVGKVACVVVAGVLTAAIVLSMWQGEKTPSSRGKEMAQQQGEISIPVPPVRTPQSRVQPTTAPLFSSVPTKEPMAAQPRQPAGKQITADTEDEHREQERQKAQADQRRQEELGLALCEHGTLRRNIVPALENFVERKCDAEPELVFADWLKSERIVPNLFSSAMQCLRGDLYDRLPASEKNIVDTFFFWKGQE